MKKKLALLLLALVVLSCFALVACGKEAPSISFYSPTKQTYNVGESLDLTGSKFVITYADGTNQTVDVTTAMLDQSTLPNMQQIGNYTVKLTYDEMQFSFAVQVVQPDFALADIEAKFVESFNYVRTNSLYQDILCREVYNDGTFGEWYNVDEQDVVSATIADGVVSVQVEQVINNKSYVKTITAPMASETLYSVSELKTQPTSGTYMVNGILVAMATTVTTEEFVLADKVTGEFISVVGLNTAGIIYNYNFDTHGFEVGDELILPVTLSVKSTSLNSSNGRLQANYVGGDAYSTAVVSKGNTVAYDKQNAFVIDSQDDLVELLTEPARKENHYKMVKITGQINFVAYTNSAHIRFWVENGEIDTLAEQRVGGGNLSPCFNDGTQFYTTGATFTEMVFGKGVTITESWTTPPATKLVEIYALFIGGNNYYHEFVVLSQDDVTFIQEQLDTQTFVAPTKTTYILNETLDLTGAKVINKYTNRGDEEVAVTLDMLDATTLPNMAVAGTYTVKGSYEGFAFQFDVIVEDLRATSIEVLSLPNTVVYGHRATPADFDLTGGKIKVNYSDGSFEEVAMDASMFGTENPQNWKIGQVDYTVSYAGFTTTVTFTIENRALSIAEFLAGTPGQVYDVTGVIVGPGSSHAMVEMLLKDKNGNNLIGVANTGIVGAYDNIAWTSDELSIGDEVVVKAKLALTASTQVGLSGRLYADVTGQGFALNTVVLSKGNALNMAAMKQGAVEVDSQDDLKAFINGGNFHKVAKLVGVKGVVAFDGYRAFFGNDVKAVADQRLNGGYMSPFIYRVNANFYLTNKLQTYFNNAESTDFANPATTTATIYVLFLGGNNYYYDLLVLDDSWVEVVPYTFNAPTKTLYTTGQALDLTGCTLVSTATGNTINVTADMLDATTYNLNQVGDYTVRGTYDGFDFTFAIQVKAQELQSIAVVGEVSPLSVTASATDVANALCQLKLELSYNTGSPEQIAITADMVSVGTLALGDNTVTINYGGKTTTVVVKLVNNALTVSQIKALPASTDTHELTGVVMSSTFIADIVPTTTWSELLIREKGTNNVIGIRDAGVSGTDYLAGLEKGDEIIIKVVLKVTSTNVNESDVGKIAPFKVAGSNVVVVSKGNDVKLDVAQATTLADFAAFTNWLKDADTRNANRYKLAKIPAGTGFVNYSASNRSMYLAYNQASAAATKVDGRYPYFIDMNYAPAHGSLDILQEFFGTSTINADWTNKSILQRDAYVMYVGGQGVYYHHFIWLGSDYIAQA